MIIRRRPVLPIDAAQHHRAAPHSAFYAAAAAHAIVVLPAHPPT
jgi:hypothetical protein